MFSQENSTGRPLADAEWLEHHHRAKLLERTAFAKMLASLNPKSIIDLGCATGLWLEIFNQILSSECEFVGIDSDRESLELAAKRSESWQRKTSFMCLDIERDANLIPSGDLTLAFNIFPYVSSTESLLNVLASRVPRGTLAVRQYDGASIRFGPMPTSSRQRLEANLRVATESSQRFRHYDLDRTFDALQCSHYSQKDIGFELFERSSPFSDDFLPYYKESLDWTRSLLSEEVGGDFDEWINSDHHMANRYFYGVDLVALLS